MGTHKRICGSCDVAKPHDEFYTDNRDKQFYKATTCIECMKANAKKAYQKKKNRIKYYKHKATKFMGWRCHYCDATAEPCVMYFEAQFPPKTIQLNLGDKPEDYKNIFNNPDSFKDFYKLVCRNCAPSRREANSQ